MRVCQTCPSQQFQSIRDESRRKKGVPPQVLSLPSTSTMPYPKQTPQPFPPLPAIPASALPQYVAPTRASKALQVGAFTVGTGAFFSFVWRRVELTLGWVQR